jgi:hypothetical protein
VVLAESNFLGWDDLIRFGTVAGVVWAGSWFLYRQQMSIKELIYTKFSELKNTFTDKLEYHEAHDDKRFDEINRNMWLMRVRQAASTGQIYKNDFPAAMRDENGNPVVTPIK